MKIVREIESKRVISWFYDSDFIDFNENGLYVNRQGFLHIKPNEHEIVDGILPEFWSSFTYTFDNGIWNIVDQTAYDATVVEQTNKKSVEVREERNQRLKNSDWTQFPDVVLSDKDAWTTYRQMLRDVPSQAGFPWSVDWPTKP